MKRSVVVGVGIASLVAAAVPAWMEVRREREFRRLIAVGDAALAQDQTYVAIEAFSGALVLKRESMLPHLKRGDTYRQRGELSAALRDLGEARALDPTAPRPVELLGDVNATMGRHQRAAQYYQDYLALDDRAPRVLYKLALARYRNGQATQAIDPLWKALALDDRFAEAHYLLGVCLRARNRRTDALRALNRAIAINAALSAAREELADLYAQLGRGRDSIEQLEALAALEPGRAERLVSVGLAYARLGRPDSALVTLERAADRFPGDPAVYTALGRIWLEMSESRFDSAALGKALAALQPMAIRPDATSEALTLYGRALFLSGNAAGAERVLQQSVARFPVEPQAFRYLAEAARRLGHTAVAREAELRYASLVRT
jgi:tetratricopeptide (TPR) repeat protein